MIICRWSYSSSRSWWAHGVLELAIEHDQHMHIYAIYSMLASGGRPGTSPSTPPTANASKVLWLAQGEIPPAVHVRAHGHMHEQRASVEIITYTSTEGV